ncbi:hypothetical protein A1O3_08414 [Capronia epimyces CBS 606.96]|uniref:Major facilitator superfamily (MFS) profile domain-containing protein n=1 Tax=Capronia epimyces CBS 606.96 TaxID=1182542 RepID=W9Y968_9EURO|nr:uncharacterized protein A1O3_08414 [Capronia epimyces CBS 606.96]EXJ78914.1 hypothetical protein A1O3_08414 [Capronia epimyces CBS 606.96]
MSEPTVKALEENVARRNIEHAKARGVENGKDVSTEKRTWKNYFWDSWDKSPEERRLIFKADSTLLAFACLGTFVKYLDRSNINNAFVSGMKEEMSLYGNELIHANSYYYIGGLIGLWPINLLLTRTNPRYLIPSLELGWTLATFGQAKMTTADHMYALRALVGLFEYGHFSAVMYLCGAWYQKAELGRRMGLINAATAIGPMISAYLQAAAYNGLDGKGAMSGWRWLFIVDGIISIGVLLPQFFVLPDVPSRQKKDWIFTEQDIELARDRNPIEGRIKQGRFTLFQIKRWLVTPEIWLLWIISFSSSVGFYPSNSMSFWFKAWNSIKPGSYTVGQINAYTTPIYAMDLLQMLLFGWLSDTLFRGRRWPSLLIGCSINLLVVILLAATPVFPKHRAFRFFLYTQTSWGTAASTMFWAWTNEILKGDPATRAFAGAGLNIWAGIAVSTIPLGVFQTVQQPAVTAGNWTAAGFLILEILATSALAYWSHRKHKRLINDDNVHQEAEIVYSDQGTAVDSKVPATTVDSKASATAVESKVSETTIF